MQEFEELNHIGDWGAAWRVPFQPAPQMDKHLMHSLEAQCLSAFCRVETFESMDFTTVETRVER